MRLLFALLVMAAAPVYAWDNGGHEIVDAIAYAHLNPKAKQAVDQLAPQLHSSHGNYDAITLGCWMDDIRNDTTLADYGRFKSWHYIDIPLDARDPTPAFEPGTDTDVHGNAVQGLKRALVVLKGGTDPYVRDQATALALIEHLVGDVHQPLHCATKYFFSHGERRDDRGGNDEFVVNGAPGDTQFNLHAFWDAAYRAHFDGDSGNVALDSKADPVRIAQDIDHAEIPPVQLVVNFDAWARESNALARDVVYPGITATDNAKFCRLGSAYVAQSRELARRQLALAGLRLATLLNETLGGAIPPPVSH
jgi:hypothetical protein